MSRWRSSTSRFGSRQPASRRTLTAFAALVVASASLLGGPAVAAGASTPNRAAAASTKHPNIVFVLTDDLSWNLINEQFAPHIVALERRGETVRATTSWPTRCAARRARRSSPACSRTTRRSCEPAPGRRVPEVPVRRASTRRPSPVALQTAGYPTSMLGKYLNGYGDPLNPTTAPVPPGWSDWHVSNSTGYAEFNYFLNDNGTFNTYNGPAELRRRRAQPRRRSRSSRAARASRS